MNNDYQNFITAAGWKDATLTPISQDASNRHYFRVANTENTVILMDAKREATHSFDAFINVSKNLRSIGLSAPDIYSIDRLNKFMLIEDLGKKTFADDLNDNPELEFERYQAAISMIVELQHAPTFGLQHANTTDLVNMLAPFFEIPEIVTTDNFSNSEVFNEVFRAFESALIHRPVLSLRDCHVENLIWMPNRVGVKRVGILDFQDAFLCDPCYDLVSLLWDVRRDLDATTRNRLISFYANKKNMDVAELMPRINVLKFQRNLRILGIFDRLINSGKHKYSKFVPRTLEYVNEALDTSECSTLQPYLRKYITPLTTKYGCA